MFSLFCVVFRKLDFWILVPVFRGGKYYFFFAKWRDWGIKKSLNRNRLGEEGNSWEFCFFPLPRALFFFNCYFSFSTGVCCGIWPARLKFKINNFLFKTLKCRTLAYWGVEGHEKIYRRARRHEPGFQPQASNFFLKKKKIIFPLTYFFFNSILRNIFFFFFWIVHVCNSRHSLMLKCFEVICTRCIALLGPLECCCSALQKPLNSLFARD